MTGDELDELVAELREEAATAAASEGDYYADQFTYHGCGEAADAIEWLRAEIASLRLTDEEREAVEWAIYEGPLRSQAEGAEERATTLRKLLERVK